MSITFPSALQYALKNRAMQIEWVAHVYDGTNYLYLAERERTISSNKYYGIVRNWGEVVRSIDLANCTSSIERINITCANEFKNDTLSAELLHHATRKYINKKVLIYMIADNETNIANACLVYEGRLRQIRHTQEDCVLEIETHSPFEHLTIPNTKTSDRGIYVPVIYGSYTEVLSSASFADGAVLHPLPVCEVKNQHIYLLTNRSETTKTTVYMYEKDFNVFSTLSDDNGATVTYDTDKNALLADYDLDREFKARPLSVHADSTFTNSANAIDGDTSTTYAECSLETSTNTPPDSATDEDTLVFDFPNMGVGTIDWFYVHMHWEATLSLVENTPTPTEYSGKLEMEEISLSSEDNMDSDEVPLEKTHSDGFDNYSITKGDSAGCGKLTAYQTSNQLPTKLQIRAKITNTFTAGTGVFDVDATVKIYDVWVVMKQVLDFANNEEGSLNTVNGITEMYAATDGYDADFTDGSGSTATEIHEIHRDIMDRFGGIDYDNDYMENWSALDTARSGWNARLWILEPKPLQEVLDQLQFEGGFIFLLNTDSDGSGNPGGKYIWIKNTYSSGDVEYTYGEEDYENLEIGTTEFSDIVTKRTYNYNPHPAENRYQQTETYTNSTQRTNLNIGSSENHEEVNLDYLVNCGDNTNDIYDTGSSDGDDAPNETIVLYYDNILAEPKMVVQFDITNLAKSDIEVGSIIQLDDAYMDPFGESWADVYFMVVETRRSPDNLSITAREVYRT